ncbi:Tyrosine-protein kinase-like otk [Dissostichus eleginoides]|uniref:Tyrosine-protein kinase-like otk n=1 Tax=Dissostichus eleginoides TaxID=100907 RepID=A0AAD9BRM0_DISEL|nr:Tyrosine-protein kinase-like otk [Dissostichus eleginoides]
MSEFRRIIMSSFLMLLLHFTAADVKDNSRIVRVGHKVALPFENVIHDQDKCENTIWLFSGLRSSAAVTLFEGGQIQNDAKAKRDRLRVIKNCSLVIKKVTEEDVGLYFCRQFRSGEQQSPDSRVDLSVVTITEHQDNDETFRPQSSGLLRLIIVSVGLAALIISVVTVNMWTRAKENKTQLEDNIVSINIG